MSSKEEMRSFANELAVRCLFDPLEFLFKIDMVDEFVYSVPSSRMSRAMNLFSMREYYQVSSILKCIGSNRSSTVGSRVSEYSLNGRTVPFKSGSGLNGLASGSNESTPSLNGSSSGRVTVNRSLSYSYCSCCLPEEVFLRNYALYILSSLKSSEESGFYLEGIFYSDDLIDRVLDGLEYFIDVPDGLSVVFQDPFLFYMLIISKRERISVSNFKKCLLFIMDEIPFFWDVYKLLSEIFSVPELDEVSEKMKNVRMRRVFILYVGSHKSILTPALRSMIDSNLSLSLYEEGLVVSILGHYKDNFRSLELMEKVLEKSSDWSNFDQFSNVLYSLKDTERLSSLLFLVFDRFGNLPIYNYVSGNVLALKSDHLRSIEEFKKILSDELSGYFDIAYIFIAQEYFHMKDTCSAIKACNLAIKKNFNDYRVWLSMGQIYFSIEMFEYALHFYRKCAELSPEVPSVYEGLGQCFDRLGREEEAIRCYSKSVEFRSVKGVSLLGDLLFRMGRGEYVKYYVKYLEMSFSSGETVDLVDVNLKTVERLIESLEKVVDPKTVLGWRRSLTILKDRIE